MKHGVFELIPTHVHDGLDTCTAIDYWREAHASMDRGSNDTKFDVNMPVMHAPPAQSTTSAHAYPVLACLMDQGKIKLTKNYTAHPLRTATWFVARQTLASLLCARTILYQAVVFFPWHLDVWTFTAFPHQLSQAVQLPQALLVPSPHQPCLALYTCWGSSASNCFVPSMLSLIRGVLNVRSW